MPMDISGKRNVIQQTTGFMVAFIPILSYVKTQKIYKTINLNFHTHWYISDKCYQYVCLVIKTRLCKF